MQSKIMILINAKCTNKCIVQSGDMTLTLNIKKPVIYFIQGEQQSQRTWEYLENGGELFCGLI